MSIRVTQGCTDETIAQLIEALTAYQAKHSKAQIDLYRQNSVSVRIRIIDPDLVGRSRAERNKYVWNYFNSLPEEMQSDVSSLILLTPEETKMSFANFEFEHPVSSNL